MKQNKKRMTTIGLTGGVGCGKSFIMAYLKEHCSCEILLADEAAHLVEKSGTECYKELVHLLGQDVIGTDGELDKEKMAQKIFQNPEILKKVNEIVHPAVRSYIMEWIDTLETEGHVRFFFLEAALLLEENYDAVLDEIWYIYADENIRRQRLIQSRGYSNEKIDAIMRHQLSEEVFRERCKTVIVNNGDLSVTYDQIDKKLEEYL